MTTAFQDNAFQTDAFQIDAYVLTVETAYFTITGQDVTLTYNVVSIPSPGVFGGAGKLTGHVGRGYSDKPRLSQLSEIRARIQREDEEILALLVAVVQSRVLNGRRY